MPRRAPDRLRPLVAILLVSTLLSSCFTEALWTLEADSTDSSRDRGAGAIAWRVALTPFTFVLDLLTMPLQVANDDDDEVTTIAAPSDDVSRTLPRSSGRVRPGKP